MRTVKSRLWGSACEDAQRKGRGSGGVCLGNRPLLHQRLGSSPFLLVCSPVTCLTHRPRGGRSEPGPQDSQASAQPPSPAPVTAWVEAARPLEEGRHSVTCTIPAARSGVALASGEGAASVFTGCHALQARGHVRSPVQGACTPSSKTQFRASVGQEAARLPWAVPSRTGCCSLSLPGPAPPPGLQRDVTQRESLPPSSHSAP